MGASVLRCGELSSDDGRCHSGPANACLIRSQGAQRIEHRREYMRYGFTTL